ncbi:hypothetical protein [Paenibacillus sp. OK003]|uniref:hypothetical protein n=1 Tax=Paenibacillus sp. OK003 TaxID=1884380 RepID=UPI0008C02F63|nr:hypothetical protein [Paenibacillus sp. OK003]SEL40331.1 hypothetical protein SAMN05518856_110204 [Paenibacillus sp. OK003]
MRLNQSIKLGFLAMTLSFTAIGATLTTPQTALSAPVPTSKAVYHQFQIYWKNATKSTASLIQARKYLLNHIDEVSPWQATLMTLQLENLQNIKLAELEEKMYTDLVQIALSQAHSKIGYEQKLTYSRLIREIKDPAIRKLLQEASDLGYKLETSEGIYYPIINYETYKKFQPFVKPDIAAYIDIMAAESNQTTTSDAAIVVPWDEFIRRILEKEAFLNTYPNSNRTSMVTQSFYVRYLFYGSDNTPAYEWNSEESEEQVRTLDPEVKKAYEKALLKRDPNTKSELLDTIERLLPVLNQNNDELSPEIEKIIEPVLHQYGME